MRRASVIVCISSWLTIVVSGLLSPAGALYVDSAAIDANSFTTSASFWSFRKQITIQESQVPADLTNFPVLINLPSDADLAANAQEDGDDVYFTSSDGTTKLSHEIELFNGTSGELIAWVKVPNLSSSANTVLYMYYGHPGAPNQDDPTNVWDANSRGVWHLKEAPSGTTDEIGDSTSNGNHGTTEGAMDAADSVAAKIGRGLEFDGSNDLVRVLDSGSLDLTSDEGTFGLWVKWVDAADGDSQIVMSSSNRFTAGANDGYEWASQLNGNHFFYPWGGNTNNYNLGSNPFTNGQWHHLVVTLQDSTKEVDIYIDGVSMTFSTENVPTYWTALANPADWLWGGNPDRATRYFAGSMDEIRVSDVRRSVGWIQTEFNNQGDPASFYIIGAEEAL